MFARRVALGLLLVVLVRAGAARADQPFYQNLDLQQHVIRNQGPPTTSGNSVRLGDMPGTGLPCGVWFTGGSPLFRCGVAGTDYQAALTSPDASILFPTASTIRLRDVTGLSVMGRAGGSAGPAADITATADGQFLQRAGGALIWGGVPSASVSGTPNTMSYFNGSGALATLTLAPEFALTSGTFSLAAGGVTTPKLADAGVTYAKIQNVAAGKLLGNGGASPAPPAEVTVLPSLVLSPSGLGLANVPAGTPVLGSLRFTAANPSTGPPAGFSDCRIDSTTYLWTCFDAFGIETHGVQSSTGANFVTGIWPDGHISRGGVSATQVAGLWPVALTGNGSDLNPVSTPLDRLSQSGASDGDVSTYSVSAGKWVAAAPAVGGITQLTGPVTAGPGSGSQTTAITAHAVTYGNIQTEGASTLLGNPTASPASPSEISVGSGIALSVGGVLSAAVAALDHKVAVDGTDGAPEYLAAKLVATNPITLTVAASGPPMTGLKAWIKADAVTTSGSLVTAWPDQSGNGNNFTSPSGHQPTVTAAALNGLPGITFDGATTYLTGGPNLEGAAYALIVFQAASTPHSGYSIATVKGTSPSTKFAEFMFDLAGSGYRPYDFANDMVPGTPTAGVGSATATSTSAQAFEWSYDGVGPTTSTGAYTSAINGTGQAIVTDTTGLGRVSTDQGSIGARVTSGGTGSFFFAGKIYEVLLYDHVLTATDYDNARGYLQRWGIAISGSTGGGSAETLVAALKGGIVSGSTSTTPQSLATAIGTGIPKCTTSGGSCTLSAATIQASGSSGGGDAQGPGAYITALTGAGTATGPGAATLTLNLAAGATVTGALPLGNQAAPTGTGLAGVTAGAWDAAATTISTGLHRTTGVLTADLSVGVAGGQSAIGGTAATDSLTLKATSASPTSGARINLQTVSDYFDPVAGSFVLSTGANPISLTGALAQNIVKAGGALNLGTSDAHSVVLVTGGASRITLDSAGTVTFNGFGSGVAKLTSGSLGLATSSDITAVIAWPVITQVLVSAGTSLGPVGDSNFTYNTGTHTLTVSGTANLSGTTVIGSGTGLLKTTAGTVGLAAAGTDYQAPVAWPTSGTITASTGSGLTSDPNFTLNTGTHTVTSAGTTVLSGTTVIGAGTGLLKVTAGTVGVATAGTDYQAPLTWPTAGDVVVSNGSGSPTADPLFIVNTGTHLVSADHIVLGGADGSSYAILMNKTGTQMLAKHGGLLEVATDDANSVAIGTNGVVRQTIASTGELLYPSMFAPSAPAAGTVAFWNDTTNGNPEFVTSTGQLYIPPRPKTLVTNQFLTAILSTGQVLAAQPNAGNLSDWPTTSGCVVLSTGSAATCDTSITANTGTHVLSAPDLVATAAIVDSAIANNSVVRTDGGHTLVAATAGTDYVQTASATAPVVNNGTAANPTFSLGTSHVSTGAGTYNVGTGSITVDTYGLITAAAGTFSVAPFDVMHFFVTDYSGITTTAWLVPNQATPIQQSGAAPPETKLAFTPVHARMLVHNLAPALSGCSVTYAVSKSSNAVVATELSVTAATASNTYQDTGLVSLSGSSTDTWGVILASVTDNSSCLVGVYVTVYFYAQ